MRCDARFLLLALAVPPAAAAQVPAGGEFRVNVYSTSGQLSPSASMDAAGRMVLSWTSGPQAPSLGQGIMSRRFDASGAPIGGEFQVPQSTVSLSRPNVASNPGGDFVVTWYTWSSLFPFAIAQGQLFSADGVRLGGEFRATSQQSGTPAAAWTPAGGFVVVWTQGYFDPDIWGQRFDASGAKVGAEFRINTFTASQQTLPAVAANAQGQFLVVWESFGQDGSGLGVYAQRFDATGTAQGAEFRVNTSTANDQRHPRTAAAAGGSFVVVWQTGAGSSTDVMGRRFASDGSPLGVEFRANSYTMFEQGRPAVAADAAGNFVVSWTSMAQDGEVYGIFAQRFNGLAQPRGAEFRVNTTTTDSQDFSAVAVDPYGNILIAWTSLRQDGDSYGVYGQRYGGLYGAALSVDTSGNGVLEPGESVDVRTSWRNVNGAAQTIGGRLPTIAGPPGAMYTITDTLADYGTVANGAVGACIDCYGVAVSNPPTRPSAHWDAFAPESILPDDLGQQKSWTLHLGGSFADVTAASPFYRYIETLLHHGVAAGCAATTYCPGASTTREQMAVFVLLAREGGDYRPPACMTPVFADVPVGSPFCAFVEELARRGVVNGCGGGNYCPNDTVTREQMAVFVLRTLDPALAPPACATPVFADVPASSPFCRWIEELARRRVVSGCGGGNYCPTAAVTRQEMSVFLGVTFGLTLYGA